MKRYGKKINAEQTWDALQAQVESNRLLHQKSRPGIPLCIWGEHGIGKTDLVKTFARQQHFKLVMIALAQFEEMGDLLGMPSIENQQTVLKKPAWAPEGFGPGILLIDDFNRADLRILRGIMPLLQDGALLSWALPPDWHIVLTANPDHGDYQVTTLDEAIVTRMLHVDMQFEISAWLRWAEKQKIPQDLLDFVVFFPELLGKGRSTARTLSQFFFSLQDRRVLETNTAQLEILAYGYLDAETALAFMQYWNTKKWRLPNSDTILESTSFTEELTPQLSYLLNQETMRVDVLQVVWERLLFRIKTLDGQLSGKNLKNLKTFLQMENLPKDIRKAWVLELLSLDKPGLEQSFREPIWAQLLL